MTGCLLASVRGYWDGRSRTEEPGQSAPSLSTRFFYGSTLAPTQTFNNVDQHDSKAMGEVNQAVKIKTSITIKSFPITRLAVSISFILLATIQELAFSSQ